MAFLCPVRIRRGKKKKPIGSDIDKDLTSSLGLNHGMGRITGSASIETLVRVGIEKEHGLSPDSKMVVLHDFTPCVDDELEVKRGQIVNILYRENDWVYVIGQDTRQEGFIPHSYCAPFNTQLADLAIKKKLPRDIATMGQPGGGGGGGVGGGGVAGGPGATPGVGGLVGGGIGNGVGLTASDLTDGMPDISMDVLDDSTGPGLLTNALKHSQASLSSEPDFLPFAKDPSGRYIVLYTFIARDENDVSVERGEFVTVLNREDPEWFWIAQAPDDLSVRRGDWIYADLNNQTVDGWLWAYAPKTRKYGFIPKAYARPPAMTSL
uniref:SH3 domain-containing protein n=1 Tax=Anopheles farauti TaxID=69004 RepID=A0A182QLD8_9DIPT